MLNSLYVPEKTIPAHTIYRCCDCEHFQEYHAAYHDGNNCEIDPKGDIRTVPDDEIPDWCPKLEKLP